MIVANDYTRLRDRPKRWWVWRFSIAIPGLLAALTVLLVGLVLAVSLIKIAPGWPVVVSLVASIATYFLWGHVRPDGMRVGLWLLAIFDYVFRQPRHFYGLQADHEPSRIAWTVIVYEKVAP